MVLLSQHELEVFREPLAICPQCREELAMLVREDVIDLAGPIDLVVDGPPAAADLAAAVPAGVSRPTIFGRWKKYLFAFAAIAATLLIALHVWNLPHERLQRQVTTARRALAAGDNQSAFEQASRPLDGTVRLDAATAAAARHT